MKLSALTQSILNPSVKESIDNLPMGLCCYWPGGLVKLKNRRMEELSFALTGESLARASGASCRKAAPVRTASRPARTRCCA